ncbi:ribosome-recycling factor, mitochondrial-like [Oscarella lobularis]|uniref:ribosome-recycling factor, mitochondrial-like n=1 Tax=Oscarella lobularis TaxID=121494 RepID=UPI0033141D1C
MAFRLHIVLVRTFARRVKKAAPTTFVDPDLLDEIDMKAHVSKMQSTLDALKQNYSRKLTTKLSPEFLEDVIVTETNSKRVPLKQLGQVAYINKQTISVNLSTSPKSLNSVVQSLVKSGLELNPIQRGTSVEVAVPKVTREFRLSLVKTAQRNAEDAKVSIRRIRQAVLSKVKSKKKEMSDDNIHLLQKYVDSLTSQITDEIEEILSKKKSELLDSKK